MTDESDNERHVTQKRQLEPIRAPDPECYLNRTIVRHAEMPGKVDYNRTPHL